MLRCTCANVHTLQCAIDKIVFLFIFVRFVCMCTFPIYALLFTFYGVLTVARLPTCSLHILGCFHKLNSQRAMAVKHRLRNIDYLCLCLCVCMCVCDVSWPLSLDANELYLAVHRTYTSVCRSLFL